VLYLRYFLIGLVVVLGVLVGAWLFNACQEEDAEDGELGMPPGVHVLAA
jgi:hypothetical protein